MLSAVGKIAGKKKKAYQLPDLLTYPQSMILEI
jgi:hypothetical protein